jgi:hypothetical protein
MVPPGPDQGHARGLRHPGPPSQDLPGRIRSLNTPPAAGSPRAAPRRAAPRRAAPRRAAPAAQRARAAAPGQTTPLWRPPGPAWPGPPRPVRGRPRAAGRPHDSPGAWAPSSVLLPRRRAPRSSRLAGPPPRAGAGPFPLQLPAFPLPPPPPPRVRGRAAVPGSPRRASAAAPCAAPDLACPPPPPEAPPGPYPRPLPPAPSPGPAAPKASPPPRRRPFAAASFWRRAPRAQAPTSPRQCPTALNARTTLRARPAAAGVCPAPAAPWYGNAVFP